MKTYLLGYRVWPKHPTKIPLLPRQNFGGYFKLSRFAILWVSCAKRLNPWRCCLGCRLNCAFLAFVRRGRCCASFARRGLSPQRRVTTWQDVERKSGLLYVRRRCGLLPNYFRHLLLLGHIAAWVVRCGRLFLQTWRGLWMCLFVKIVSPAKTAEPTETPFSRLTRVGQRNHVLSVFI